MYILPRIKKIAACSLAILLTLGTFGLTKNDTLVTTHADKGTSEYAQKLDDLSDTQKSLEKKIADANDSIKGQQEKLNNVAEQMNVISNKIQTAEKYSKEIEDEICTLDDKMRETEYNLSKKEDEIKENVNSFMKRVRAMYVSGTDSYTSIIANSADFYDILMRTELIKKVAQHDNDTINTLSKQKKDIDKTKSDLEKQSSTLQEKSNEYSAQQKSLSDEYNKLVSMQKEYGDSIAALKNDKNNYQAEVNKVIDEYKDVAAQSQTAQATTKTTTIKTTTKQPAKTTSKSTSKSYSQQTNKTTTTKAKPTTTPKKTTANTQPTNPPVSDYEDNSSNSSQIDILMSTARSMVGGSYVWGAASPTATDCSGLTMQCYAKIGISLPHKASSQANYGTSVSYSNMRKGDLIFFGGSSYSSIYHVAIYVGDGKMIHAENSNTGVVVSYVSSFSKYNNITCIKRLI